MIQAIRATTETELVKADKAIDMFCDMCEIVLSASINESSAKVILESLPDDILREMQNGFDFLRNLSETVIQSRKK